MKAKAGSLRGKPGAYSQSGTRHKAALDGTAGYGTVRPVVWEDGGGAIPRLLPDRDFAQNKNGAPWKENKKRRPNETKLQNIIAAVVGTVK